MAKRRRWLKIAALIAAALALAFYYGCVDRLHQVVEKDGWYLDQSYLRMRCPVCSGRVERLECDGRPVVVPRARRSDGQPARLRMECPVGVFFTLPDDAQWHWHHGSAVAHDVEEAITPEELARGHYRIEPLYERGQSGCNRKHGTPAHWCMIREAETIEYGYWIAPDRLDSVELTFEPDEPAGPPPAAAPHGQHP